DCGRWPTDWASGLMAIRPMADAGWATGLCLLDPAALLVGPPIRHLEALGLGFAPALTRRGHRLLVFTVEQQHDSLVSLCVLGHRRAIDQKADVRAVGIVVARRQQHRL